MVVHSQALPTVSEDCSDPQKLREQLANTRAQLEALKAKCVHEMNWNCYLYNHCEVTDGPDLNNAVVIRV